MPAAEQERLLTLEEAVDFALKNYPAVRAALERVTAAQAGVGLARTSYLPRADVVWQTNRATDNNITGLLLPQSIIAPISGPVPATCQIAAHGEARPDCYFPGSHSILDTAAPRSMRHGRPDDQSRRGSIFDAPRCGCRDSERLPDGAGAPNEPCVPQRRMCSGAKRSQRLSAC